MMNNVEFMMKKTEFMIEDAELIIKLANYNAQIKAEKIEKETREEVKNKN